MIFETFIMSVLLMEIFKFKTVVMGVISHPVGFEGVHTV